ncbi:sensor domain-containing diguanylate cyclase [Sporosarcina sp. FA9]|uniref:sensor domain-containing diguanylate cyclase n=1 Tax=Sporosarcina sp. FA9 TaxID=3413030 RepID=UPI003F65AC68
MVKTINLKIRIRGDLVANHQMTLYEIKNDLINLWSKDTAFQSDTLWFEMFKETLQKNFGVKNTDYLVYDNGEFVPLGGNKSNSKRIKLKQIGQIKEGSIKNKDFYINLFRKKGYENIDEIVTFVNDHNEILGIFLIESTEKWRDFSKTSYYVELEKTVSHLIQMVRKMGLLISREKNFRQLFSTTELFNSTMDSQVILDGIIQTIAEFYPSFDTELLLSQDYRELTKSYKLFNYKSERPSAVDAFVSGEMTIEDAVDLSEKIINVPIKGRQGIYGVLQIMLPLDYVFTNSQRNFINMLANTAGSALENASLYDQTHKMNDDLRLVNEVSRKLNSNMYFGEMIAYLKQQLLTAFRPSEIAFVFYDDIEVHTIMSRTSEFFITANGEQYIDYVSKQLEAGKESVFDPSFSSTIKEEVHYESVIAIPITNHEKMVGFVVCLHEEQYRFSFDSFKLMQSLIGHSSLALANSMLREQLQELADKDYLTKLYARRYLDNIVMKSIELDEGGVLILLDIDDFKLVNDNYGHGIGDEVLKQISSYVLMEIEGKGVAARWGGEELALYLPRATIYEGSNFAKKLINEIPLLTNPSVTISCGVSGWKPNMETTFKSLFQYTDKALYTAKETGKNQVIINKA